MGSHPQPELSAVNNCEIAHAIDLMPTRQNETGGVRGLAKVLSAQTLDYGMVDAAAVRVKASNIPLVVGFKATRTELCWLSYALLSVAMHAVEDLSLIHI